MKQRKKHAALKDACSSGRYCVECKFLNCWGWSLWV